LPGRALAEESDSSLPMPFQKPGTMVESGALFYLMVRLRPRIRRRTVVDPHRILTSQTGNNFGVEASAPENRAENRAGRAVLRINLAVGI